MNSGRSNIKKFEISKVYNIRLFRKSEYSVTFYPAFFSLHICRVINLFLEREEKDFIFLNM